MFTKCPMCGHDNEVFLVAYNLNFGTRSVDVHEFLDPGSNLRTGSKQHQSATEVPDVNINIGY